MPFYSLSLCVGVTDVMFPLSLIWSMMSSCSPMFPKTSWSSSVSFLACKMMRGWEGRGEGGESGWRVSDGRVGGE